MGWRWQWVRAPERLTQKGGHPSGRDGGATVVTVGTNGTEGEEKKHSLLPSNNVIFPGEAVTTAPTVTTDRGDGRRLSRMARLSRGQAAEAHFIERAGCAMASGAQWFLALLKRGLQSIGCRNRLVLTGKGRDGDIVNAGAPLEGF